MNLNQYADANLTLVNADGEVYPAGEITTLIHTNSGLKLRWKLNNPFTNALPFTHAIVHRGEKIIKTVAIRPLDNGAFGTEIELHV